MSFTGRHVHQIPDTPGYPPPAQAVVTPQQIILAAEVTTDANDVQKFKPMLDLAQAVVETVIGEDAVLGAAAADAGYWSDDNVASQTADRKQRAELRDTARPRGRIPKGLSPRQRMQRKLRTKRGRAIYRQRGSFV